MSEFVWAEHEETGLHQGPHRPNQWCMKVGCKPYSTIEERIAERYEEIRMTSKTGGQKGSKLARFDLIPAEALWQVAELYGKGAEKYAPWNWRKGYDWSLSIAALERHLSLFKAGEDMDEETGMPHLTSIVFHALTLLTFMDEQEDYDDRWQPPFKDDSSALG